MNPIKKFTTIFIIEKFGGGGVSKKTTFGFEDFLIFFILNFSRWFVTLRTHHLRADLSLNTGERSLFK